MVLLEFYSLFMTILPEGSFLKLQYLPCITRYQIIQVQALQVTQVRTQRQIKLPEDVIVNYEARHCLGRHRPLLELTGNQSSGSKF